MKTASSSIEMDYGRNFMGSEDVLSKMEEDVNIEQNNIGYFNPIGELLDRSYSTYKTAFQFYHRFKFGPHQSARVIQHRVPRKVWRTYYKFTVERNPFDKMVSMYFMNWGKDGVNRTGRTFEDWVSRGLNLPFNYPLYTWKDNVLVDRIIRYENLQEELFDVYNDLGIPFKKLNERAKSGFREKGNDYRSIHTDYTREFTERIFKKEIELMEYSF